VCRKPPPIKAITFDVGGTLITPWPSVGHVYAEVAAAHGYAGLPAELLNQRFADAWKASEDFDHSRARWAALVDATFLGLIEPLPSRTFFASLFERFAEPAVWHIFDDVIPALNVLRSRGFRLGIISNWDDRLRPLLRRLRLYDYFEAVVISCEVGSPKPARIAFAQAANQLAAPPGAILHVGDSLASDVQGAKAAGFAAVCLDRQATQAYPGAVASLREIVELLTQGRMAL
jgi:putative hydrolase of the HAD superfamily